MNAPTPASASWAKRDLAGVAGDHDQRQGEDRIDERDDDGDARASVRALSSSR